MVKIALMTSALRLAVAAVLLLGVSGPVVAGVDEAAAAYKRGDYKTAYKEFRLLALDGNAEAQSNLGFMYLEGRGVPQDYAESVKWLSLAAAQGHKPSVTNRDLMAKLMSPTDISKAQKMAREWKPKK